MVSCHAVRAEQGHSAFKSLPKVATILVLAVGAVLASSAAASAAVVYDNIATPQPSNVPSTGFEANSLRELGGQVQLAGTARQNPKVTALMSSWGCENGSWNTNDCSTSSGANFSVPITLNLYNVGPSNSVGSLIKSVTQTFQIPYRPSADNVNCTGADAGKWFDGTACVNGLGAPITFNLAGQGVTLPNNVIVSLVYNTTHFGPSPIGESAPCFTESGGCGYDALNIGDLNAGPSTGSFPVPDDAYSNSTSSGFYCDGGSGGTGTFRLDSGCWTGFQPSFRISASATGDVIVNDNTSGPGPAGADCANPDFSTIHDAVNASVAGSTILVCAGNYPENVTINKSLTLKGAQAGVDARTRSVPAASESLVAGGSANPFTINGGATADTIDGFTLTHSGSSAGIGTFAGSNHLFQDNIISGDTYAINGSYQDSTLFQNRVENSDIGFEANTAPHIDGVTVSSNRFVNIAGPNGYAVHFISTGVDPHTGVVVKNNQDVNGSGNFVVLDNTDGARVTDNTVTNNGASAIFFGGSNDNTLISGNRISGATSAIRLTTLFHSGDPNDNLTVTGNVLNANTRGLFADSDAITSRLEVHGNSIAGNTTAGIESGSSLPVDATNNWWGCNAGPGNPGCDSVGGAFAGQITTSPRLVLGISAVPSTIFAGTGQSQLTADLTHNSAGAVAGTGFPDGTSVAFGAAPLGTVSPASAATVSGAAGSVLSAGATTGTTNASATLDSQTVATPVTIATPPQGQQGQQGQSGGVAGAVGKSKKCKKKKKKSKKAVVAKKCKRKKK